MAGDEQPNSPETTPTPRETEPDTPEQEAHPQRSEWVKFGILAIILVGVIFVVALARPLIFERIVPAVMGDFLPPEALELEDVAPETEPANAEETATPADAADNTGEGQNEVFIPAASGGDAPAAEAPPANPEAEAEPAETGAGETAVPPAAPTAAPVTHTVQAGENLTRIARQYSVSVQEIMAANNLVNADYISVGQVLVIPTN